MRMEHVLLVSDVDGTLVGCDRSLRRFAAWYERFRPYVRLVYASGQFHEPVAELVRAGVLPRPWAVIGGVGTDLKIYPSGRPIFNWEERLYKRWERHRVCESLVDWPGLEMQPEEFQGEHKVSYYLTDATPGELEKIRTRLRTTGIDADIVYSSRRDLDVLPSGIDKGEAAKFLAEYLDYEPDEVIVCGNSANDLAMFKHGFRGVVVGNAHCELKSLNDPHIYVSELEFAAGVMDGLHHWLECSDRSEDYEIRERPVLSS